MKFTADTSKTYLPGLSAYRPKLPGKRLFWRMVEAKMKGRR